MTRFLALAPLALVIACEMPARPPAPEDGLILLGGYRDPADQCRLAGESAATAEFLDDAADLVACPEDAENLGVFVADTGGVEVGRVGGYILFSVPRR